MNFFGKKRPAQPAPPAPGELTPEQIAGDMKRYARQNPYHGNLHALDAEEAREQWKHTRSDGTAGVAGVTGETAMLGTAEPPLSPARPCREHPGAEGVWSCIDCKSRFCDLCVRPVMSYYNPAHGGYEHRTGVCLRCKGRCIDLRFEAEKRKRVRSRQAEMKRNEAFRRTVLAVLTFQFVLSALHRYRQVTFALDLQYILFVFGLLQYGPLRNIGIITKSFFVRVLPPALMANAASYFVAGLSNSFLGKILFLTPVKYLGISLLLYGGVMMVEKTAGLFGHIYRGSQEPTGWTTFDRVSAGLSVVIIVFFVIYTIVAGI